MKAYRLATFVLVIAMASLVLGQCGATPVPATTSPTKTSPTATSAPKTLVYLHEAFSSASSSDPAYSFEDVPALMEDACYDTLVTTEASDPTLPVPSLADSWDISPDGTVYTFHIHPGVKFVSGNPVKAEDVRFSWMRLKNVKGTPSFNMDQVSKVEVVDDLTLRVALNGPSGTFLSWLGGGNFSVLDSQTVKAHGGTDAADADKTDKAKDWLDQNSAGSGPYTLTSWVPKVEMTLVANPSYWGKKPVFAKITIRGVEDPTVGLQMLQRGEADVLQYLSPDLLSQAKADKNLMTIVAPTMEVRYLGFNSDASICKPCTDKRVRQAIAYAIDYDSILNSVLNGLALRSPTIIPVGEVGVDTSLNIKQDLAKAKALLKEAGYENGFAVDLQYYTDTTNRMAVAAAIKEDLARVGITVNLKPAEYSAFMDQYKGKKAGFVFHLLGGGMDPTDFTEFFCRTDKSVAARLNYVNPQLDQLAKSLLETSDHDKRAQLVKQITTILLDEMPYIEVFQPQRVVATRSDISGTFFTAGYGPTLTDIKK